MLHKSERFLQPRYFEIAFFKDSVLWIFFVRVESSDHDNFFSSSVLFVYNILYILLLSFSFIFDVCHCTTMTNHIFFAPGSWRQRRQGIYKIRFSDYTSKCFSTPVIVLWFTETNETLCTRRNHHCQWHSLFSFS